MTICGIPRASAVLLVPRTPHDDRIVHRPQATSIERLHVEDIDALHLAEDFETIEACCLFEVGGDGAWRSAGWEKVFFRLDFLGAGQLINVGLLDMEFLGRPGIGKPRGIWIVGMASVIRGKRKYLRISSCAWMSRRAEGRLAGHLFLQ